MAAAGQRATKRGYTLCFLDKLQDSTRRRDVYVDTTVIAGEIHERNCSPARNGNPTTFKSAVHLGTLSTAKRRYEN